MKITKIHIDNIERCYSTSFITIENSIHAVFASERIGGECKAYSVDDFSKTEKIWKNAGGTMSIIKIPGSDGNFLGIQNFFPGFQSSEAKIVWGTRTGENNWSIQDFLSIPYVHRFDILPHNGINYFIACSLCNSKKDREDWSDPGKIYTGILPDSPNKEMKIEVIVEGLVKNHGYWRGRRNNSICSFVASENGIMAINPPEIPGDSWKTEILLEKPVSDMAIYDIDGDGEDEIITIEPFHGNSVKIYHKQESGYSLVYEYPREIVFAHALWAGKLRQKPSILLGGRRQKSELVLIQYDSDSKSFTEKVLEENAGPSNIAVLNQKEKDIIICANNSIGEAAALYITD